MVTKYRKPVLTGAVLQTVRDVILSVMDERSCVVHEINGEADHLHIMFDAGPNGDIVYSIKIMLFAKTIRDTSSQFVIHSLPDQTVEKG